MLEREKEPKIRPMYNPPAPKLWAYTGNIGTTIPTPVTAVNMEKNSVPKIFLSRLLAAVIHSGLCI